jgi:hypothetical protein
MASEAAAAIRAATATMRETTKWIIGGVVATAAAVFAGSSLTSLGALDPYRDTGRLALAGMGAGIGFVALGALMAPAMSLLTIRTRTFRQFVSDVSPEVRRVRENMEATFDAQLKRAGVPNFMALVAAIDDGKINPDPEFYELVLAHAGFEGVLAEFNSIKNRLFPMTALAVIGFGIFAWAANPAQTPSPKPASVILVVPDIFY